MLAITLWQPWASLIMVGAKPYEFRPKDYLLYRPFSPVPGERIGVHAGARPVRKAEVEDLLERLVGPEDTTGLVVDKARELLERVLAAPKCRLLPTGAMLGTAVLGEARNAGEIFGGRGRRMGGLPHDSDRGDFNWAWPFSAIEPLDEPIPTRGMQGFFHWNQPPRKELLI